MTDPNQEIDPRALRSAFGSFLTGITVITTVDADGTPHGFTANSFTSVSLDPPLLLVCPGRNLSSFGAFEACDRFAVSVLREGQEAVSNTFAGFKGDRFAQVGWHKDAHGVPLIDGAVAHFSCQRTETLPAGDHVILLGAIDAYAHPGGRGLGYLAGSYVSLGLEREAAAAPRPGVKAVAGAIVEHDGRILLAETDQGYAPPHCVLNERSRVRDTLQSWLANAGLQVELGKAYSVFDDRSSGTHNTYFLAQAKTDVAGGLGSFVPIGELTDMAARDAFAPGHSTMIQRYALEREAGRFALYVGDEESGDVHAMDPEQLSDDGRRGADPSRGPVVVEAKSTPEKRS